MATKKPAPAEQAPAPDNENGAGYHNRYRPSTLDRVIGHESPVATLNGIIESGRWPSAIGFFGPPSAGKTTLAYALGATVLGQNVLNNACPDFTELVGTDSRTIDDMRSLIAVSKLRPLNGTRRFILLEEAQGILSNPQAAGAILAALERPPKSTTWLFTSMEPAKFTDGNTNGKAIMSRLSTQFHLKAPTDAHLLKQAKRIRRGEDLGYMDDEFLTLLVNSCGRSMRILANMIESASNLYAGMRTKPETLDETFVQTVLESTITNDDAGSMRLLGQAYRGNISKALREVLNLGNPFQAINKMIYMNSAVMFDRANKGERHQNVWMTPPAKALKTFLNGQAEEGGQLVPMAEILDMHASLLELKATAMNFGVSERDLLAGWLARRVARAVNNA